jgi:hypothetical protein
MFAFLLSLAGCVSYMPVELETLPQGHHVRVEMTRLGFAALPEIPGQSGPRLAGTISGRDDEVLRLRVPIAVLRDGSPLRQEIVIPAREILRAEIREVNRTRTGIAIAAGLATGLALYLSLDRGEPFTGEEEEELEEEGDPETVRSVQNPRAVPWRSVLFSIRVR